MLPIKYPSGVKFISAFIYADENNYKNAKKILQKKFGEIDFESQPVDFNFTGYYYAELGRPLLRRFISFKRLRDPADFAKIKLFCIKAEKKLSRFKKRTVNIDPGYLNEAKLVLTTTKDFAHRVYLKKGVFAEVTLCYRGKGFCDLPTTFPDYRTPQYKDIFLAIREIYRKQKEEKKP